ncbi:hypothetical protein JS278_02138 [Acidipropionibacterium virtanenii]|uniref:Uncharacterized protein n=2 Tax=Acidipropionibacterium virtanenii TaxID=2057246 RepID=A0A344UVJ2_9ACTN|nr:hypothetical protein JS278_02138 [Acidipropionibacterium virtanenii]
MSRILNAALDLAREEAAGQVLAEDEKAAVDLCDEIGGVGDTAAFERQKEGLSD